MMCSKKAKSTSFNGADSSIGAYLPGDIISDILARLPIESILRCKVVCKAWYAATCDQCFINKLASSPHQPTRLILKALPGKKTNNTPNHMVLLDFENWKTMQLPIEPMLVHLQIMCSCNGLLCMASDKVIDPVVIYNPVTRDRVILPSSGPLCGKADTCHQAFGLGFDPLAEKYKVVRAYTIPTARNTLGRVTKFEIISLGESSWRELSVPEIMAKHEWVNAICWDGALYWTTKKSISSTVIQFDLHGEVFHSIYFPNNLSRGIPSCGFMDIGDCLILARTRDNYVSLMKLMGVGEDASFCLEDTYDMHVKFGGGLSCEFLYQFNPESYLLQVGLWCRRERLEHLTQYFPRNNQYRALEIPGLPSSFKALCLKPSLIPLSAASSAPSRL